jgi:hypothetical protein
VWRWPEVVGRYRPEKVEPLAQMLARAMYEVDWRLVVPRLPVAGWRWVKCDDCGTTWKETSRDIQSPSHVDCPNHCDHGGDTHVWRSDIDDALATDSSGNILDHQCVILTKGLGRNDSVEGREGDAESNNRR